MDAQPQLEHLASELHVSRSHLIDVFGRGTLQPLLTSGQLQFDLNVLRVNDPQEIDFDFSQPSYFECLETSRQTFVHPTYLEKPTG